MRRGFVLCVCLLLFAGVLTGCASSENVGTVRGSVTQMESAVTVYENGSCDVTLNVQLSLQEAPQKLLYPLPAEAKNISLNGGVARTSASGSVRYVDISSLAKVAGNVSFVIHYEMEDVVTVQKKGGLLLSLDLLTGFACPIDNMSFTISLPDAPEKRPKFVSTYHQESVDTLMTLSTQGNVITGKFHQGLKGQESLVMTLQATEALFPQPLMKRWSLSADDVAMYLCALAALIYWVFSMRALPPSRLRRAQEPVGVTAGEMGCHLTGRGADFTLMVLSWAQMGYLLIQLDDNGRVLLHKRMDMGNERKEFEVRCFRTLFGRRKTVDGTGHHYARLAAKVAKTVSGARETYLSVSGNPKLFRVICGGIGVFGGISMACALVNDTAWQVVLGLLLSLLGAGLSWQIHEAVTMVHLRKNLTFWVSLGISFVWVAVSAMAGEVGVALFVLGCQWLGGFAAAYGGRRSEAGRQNMEEILGLRRYLKSANKDDLQRILNSNPEYYYRLAPYAMALGIDQVFARQMGNTRLAECTYLTTGMDGHLTAKEWNQLLREVVATLDERYRYMALQKWLGR